VLEPVAREAAEELASYVSDQVLSFPIENHLAHAVPDLRELGEVQTARDLNRDTLERRRQILGQDHPDTLASASHLATDLRALGEADDDS
jgi:hypothetical protein